MPARTQLFDSKAKPLHFFGGQHRNTLLYQPQGKLLLSAGFGNLAGGVDIWDMSTRNKVAEFKASNSSHCEWSPCGRYILTATLSPRLRVDNGIKIWWCGGQLLHIHPQENLYQASFRPRVLSQLQSFPAVIPPAPAAHESVALYRPKGETSNGADAKPAGAYRPPGARGTLASDAYRRDDNDVSSGATTPTPMFKGGKPSERYVPGGGVPGAPKPGAAANGTKGEDKKKRVRTKRTGKDGAATDDTPAAAGEDGSKTPAEVAQQMSTMQVGEDKSSVDDAVSKKIRNLNKKVCSTIGCSADDSLKRLTSSNCVLRRAKCSKRRKCRKSRMRRRSKQRSRRSKGVLERIRHLEQIRSIDHYHYITISMHRIALCCAARCGAASPASKDE